MSKFKKLIGFIIVLLSILIFSFCIEMRKSEAGYFEISDIDMETSIEDFMGQKSSDPGLYSDGILCLHKTNLTGGGSLIPYIVVDVNFDGEGYDHATVYQGSTSGNSVSGRLYAKLAYIAEHFWATDDEVRSDFQILWKNELNNPFGVAEGQSRDLDDLSDWRGRNATRYEQLC